MKPTEVRGVDGYRGRGYQYLFSGIWILAVSATDDIWLRGDTSASLAVVCVYIFFIFFSPVQMVY